MKQGRETTSFNREVVHTLAQVGTAGSTSTLPNDFVIVAGNGSDVNNKKLTRNRAKRKKISQIMSLELTQIAMKENNPNLIKQFRNTYYCLDEVYCANGRIYGKFCKNKACTVCLAIRKAELINKYSSQLNDWPEPHFLTLTIKAVKADNLRPTILNIKDALRKIIRSCNKRHYRGKGPKLTGLYSIECNFNPKSRTYNPHFHIITKDKETATILLEEWLKRAKPGKAVRWAQDIRPINDRKNALIEVIKYGTKIMTENDLDKREKGKSKRSIYLFALYKIVEAFYRVRMFEHFGFNPKNQNKGERYSFPIFEYTRYAFSTSKSDWIDKKTATPLTGYIPTDELIEILEKRINTELN